MEEFNHKEYRNYLAKDVSEIHTNDPEKAHQVLDAIQNTSNYKKAVEGHKEDQYYERNKDQITQEKYLEIFKQFDSHYQNNYEYFDQIRKLKEETGVDLSPETIHKGYVALLDTYYVRDGMKEFEKITGEKPSFTPEEKTEIILKRIRANEYSAFDDIVRYLGSNLEKEVIERCYEELANRLYDEMDKQEWNGVIITSGQIYLIYAVTKEQAKLDEGTIQGLYKELLELPMKKKSAGPGDNVWRIDHLHQATGISYPEFDQVKVQQIYDAIIASKGYEEQGNLLVKFEEITGVKKKPW